MKLKKLNLNNYGIYYGKNEINFETSHDKNIVLIHGENGAGKTTLLNAIKLALYGPAFLGYKRQNKKYLEYIENKLNSDARLNLNNNEFSIELLVEIVEDGTVNEYGFYREWYETDFGNIKEKFDLTRNNEPMPEKKKEKFMTSFLSSTPFTLFNLYFFDGEKIDELFVSESNDDNIKAMFDIIFNLELFNILDIDLKNYIVQKNVYSELDEHQKEYLAMIKEKDKLVEDIESVKESIEKLSEIILEKNDQLKNLEKQYEVNEGLMVDEKNTIYNEMSKLLKRKNSLRSHLETVILESLPFLILEDSLSTLVKEIAEEEINTHKEFLYNEIHSDNFEGFLESNGVEKNKSISSLLAQYFNVANFTRKYSFNKDEQHVINQMSNIVSKINRNELIDSIEEIDKINEMLLKKRKIYEKNLSAEFTEKLNEINSLKHEIEAKHDEKDSLLFQVEELEIKLENLLVDIDDKKSEIRDSKKDKSIFTFTDKIQNVITMFKERVSKMKVSELSDYSTAIFKKLIRKDDFIKEIIIEEDLTINIINKNNQVVPHENLSSGETQIYILSLLWGMIKVSNRNIPLVFDTLLGRLDKSHKANIVTEFMKDISDQIIILATDSEVDDEYYALLENKISKEYTLDYNNLKSNIKTA